MPYILFGSISTVADTSELQRQAFNTAFAAHHLNWSWTRDDYLAMLDTSGGEHRIREYAHAQGQTVDAAAVHATKTAVFADLISPATVTARPGVAATVTAARAAGIPVAFVTSTARSTVTALLDALAPELGRDAFDLVVDIESAGAAKPDPAAYLFALRKLGAQPGDCVAIEDNLGGLAAARAAGITCVAFPNQNTAHADFADAHTASSELDFTELKSLALAGA
ncbi:HAD-IA family hydrolase [Williamsia sp. CHRR-6]|uniref:HAD-IA family hydrolase n=1 Tax=Williamsia sp. CHRR-6 TaxID=2835871 RepID=UPI001BDA6EA2|nr:HAD-IA family hydrolase [Williamsia sp. CHRR-6]MBT0565191.1 HAD-IA family hydrolase [Williamsia sp. CHRR-6]